LAYALFWLLIFLIALFLFYVVVLGNHGFEEITCWSGVSNIMLFTFMLLMYVLRISFRGITREC